MEQVELSCKEKNLLNPVINTRIELDEAGNPKIIYGFNSGGYEAFQYFSTADGGSLAIQTVLDEFENVDFDDPDDRQWYITGCDVNWENEDLYDDHTGGKIWAANGD